MLRLFIAIDLPAAVIKKFGRIRLPQTSGLRAVPPEQTHLTLCFLGNCNLDAVAAALSKVRASPFFLTIEGVGHFSGKRASTVLWVGVRRSLELMKLQSTVTRAVTNLSAHEEDRPFAPHITLARYKHGVPSVALNNFLSQYSQFLVPNIAVTKFGLYSSTLTDQGTLHHLEMSFQLAPDSVFQPSPTEGTQPPPAL
jgi:RNA 2',3'-cyclic 3'-phosphodiesterase